MGKLFNLSIYESELEDCEYLCEKDFEMSRQEVHDILKGLEEGIQVLEELGKSPHQEILREKDSLGKLTKKFAQRS